MNESIREITINGEHFYVPEIYRFDGDQAEPTTELCEVLFIEECFDIDCNQCIFDKRNFEAFCEYMMKGEDIK